MESPRERLTAYGAMISAHSRSDETLLAARIDVCDLALAVLVDAGLVRFLRHGGATNQGSKHDCEQTERTEQKSAHG